MAGMSGTKKRRRDSACGLRAPRKVAIMRGLFQLLQHTRIFMANTAQARKRARQAEQTRQRNAGLKSSLRSAIRKVKKAIAAGDKKAATKELQMQQSVIDRVADKKVVHKNTASRGKMRLAQAIKAMP
jgi:small subunit ribosomal protein S20